MAAAEAMLFLSSFRSHIKEAFRINVSDAEPYTTSGQTRHGFRSTTEDDAVQQTLILC